MRILPVVCCLMFVPAGFAQEAKPDKLPQIICSTPLVVVPGRESKLVLRGLFLDEITSVRIASSDVKPEIASKGKTAVPQNYDAKRVGDSQAEIKFSLPPDAVVGKVALVATSSQGESVPYEIDVLLPDSRIDEKEPNDSFKSPQAVSVGKTIVGTIHDPRNVDVFRIEVVAGQKLIAEIIATRAGSLLDPVLTLYDAKGRVISSNDDHAGTRDSRIETILMQPGAYFVTVQDANDSGGSHFAYLLKLVP